jgi:methyl-accepting chemotaxis protein
MNIIQRYLIWLNRRKLKNQLAAAIWLMMVPLMVISVVLYKQHNGADAAMRSIAAYNVLFGLIYTSIVYMFTRRYVIGPLVKIYDGLASSSQRLSLSSQELATNADTMNQATTIISTAINDIASGAVEQSDNAIEAAKLTQTISGAMSQVAVSAQNQVEKINEMAAGIAQLGSSIGDVSGNAREVASVVAEASNIAEKGKSAVDETISGMQRIKSTVLDSAYKIETLGEKSKQIGEIIEVIDDIAEQTNLLALNAAIEAARAGEHGKGFAVVADEVRKLAERSARAAGEIADLIKSIQDETMDAVETMGKGTSEVETGSKLAENAGSAIDDMMVSIRQVIAQIVQVENNIEQMSLASQLVSSSVDHIAAMSQETSATTEEVAASAAQVVNAVDSIAAASEQSASSAERMSSSTQEQTASIQEVAAKVQMLSGMSEELEGMVKLLSM